MEYVRTLMPALVLLTLGCAGTKPFGKETALESFGHKVEKAVLPERPPVPATEFACSWGKQLRQLPDPSRGGQMCAGVAGQVFLFTSDLQAAEPNGELTISATDATNRTNGSQPAKMSVWHFTADVLRKLRVDDERYGMSVAVFLPWPEDWKDVNSMTIQARYDQKDVKDGMTLFAQPTTLTLDFSPAPGASAGGVVTNHYQKLAAVPDPRTTVNALRQAKPVTNATALPMVQPAAATSVAPPAPPPAVPPVGGTGIDGEFRSVIPRR